MICFFDNKKNKNNEFPFFAPSSFYIQRRRIMAILLVLLVLALCAASLAGAAPTYTEDVFFKDTSELALEVNEAVQRAKTDVEDALIRI